MLVGEGAELTAEKLAVKLCLSQKTIVCVCGAPFRLGLPRKGGNCENSSLSFAESGKGKGKGKNKTFPVLQVAQDPYCGRLRSS